MNEYLIDEGDDWRDYYPSWTKIQADSREGAVTEYLRNRMEEGAHPTVIWVNGPEDPKHEDGNPMVVHRFWARWNYRQGPDEVLPLTDKELNF